MDCFICAFALIGLLTGANTEKYIEPVKMLTTAYCDNGITASGVEARYGICAGKKEWLGKTVILYKRNEDGTIGELLGIFEVLDTGFGTKW